MDKFTVKFEYWTPEFAEVTLDAKDDDEAVDKAYVEFEKNYPEAQNYELIEVIKH
jgi:hypothetical protein